MKQSIRITAKCSDMFGATLHDNERRQIGDYDGYVPDWLPNLHEQHYGDYIQLEIDVATGKILNWKAPTKKQLKETFGA